MKEAIKDLIRTTVTAIFAIMTIIMVLGTIILAFRVLKALCMGVLNLALWMELGCFVCILAACIGITRVLVDAGDGVYRTSSNNIGPHGSDKEGSDNEDISDNR